MIRTLQITSIIAVVLGVGFFVLLVVFGAHSDEQVEQFLNAAGVIEKFDNARGERLSDSRQETSPLVKQAEMFALYLNPPPKPQTESPVPRTSTPRPRGRVSPKFKLIGTSYYTLHPESSLALVDEPGKGLRWVRQSAEVGHLIIEQIKDGLVVVRDGDSTYEIIAERTERKSLLKKGSSSQVDAEKEVILSKETQAARQEALAELDAMLLELELTETDVEPAETNSEPKTEKVDPAKAKRRITGENMRISPDEAKRLGRLGQRLKDVNKVSRRAEKYKVNKGPDVSEPNLGDVNDWE